MKWEDQCRQRNEAEDKRRNLDEQIRLANIADARLQDEKRNQLRQLTEEDRKAKLLQRMLIDAKDNGKDASEVVDYVFDKKFASTTDSKKQTAGKSPLLKSTGAAVMKL